MKRALIAVTLIAFFSLFRCASQTRLAPEIRQRVQERHTGSIVALKMSCYYGDFYDENERWLLSPYPFSDTSDIADRSGQPIHPSGQRGIVPAGSTFRITRIEFPDMSAMTTRMLMTPRYNPWVYLEPVDAPPLAGRSSYILVLPSDIDTEDGVEAAIARRLGQQADVKRWLDRRDPRVQVAIKHKDATPGMTEEELTAAMGIPQRWFHEGGADRAEVAWYGSREVWLVKGKVTEVREARAVAGAKAPEAPTSPTDTVPDGT